MTTSRMEKRDSAAVPAAEPAMVKRMQTIVRRRVGRHPRVSTSRPPGSARARRLCSTSPQSGLPCPRSPTGVRVHYRHVHQAESWQVADMAQKTDRWQATIAGEYTKSPYPLQYYFELRDSHNRTWLFPGF